MPASSSAVSGAPENRQLEVRDPACFDQLVGTATRGSVADVDEAVAAAKAAQPGWAKIGFRERAALLAQVLDRLDRDFEARAILYVRENGRTLAEARGELGAIAVNQRLTLELADTLEQGRSSSFDRGTTFVRHIPFGVVVSIVTMECARDARHAADYSSFARGQFPSC